jgi:hypothetical protein
LRRKGPEPRGEKRVMASERKPNLRKKVEINFPSYKSIMIRPHLVGWNKFLPFLLDEYFKGIARGPAQ